MTPQAPHWKWQISTRQVWPKCLPMVFFSISYVCSWIHKRTFFRKQNDEGASKVDIIESLDRCTCSEKNEFWNFFWKKLVVLNIRSCLRTQLNQDMDYEVPTSEIIVVRHISRVFVALSLWKTSTVDEIWVEIQITHILSRAETRIAHD